MIENLDPRTRTMLARDHVRRLRDTMRTGKREQDSTLTAGRPEQPARTSRTSFIVGATSQDHHGV